MTTQTSLLLLLMSDGSMCSPLHWSDRGPCMVGRLSVSIWCSWRNNSTKWPTSRCARRTCWPRSVYGKHITLRDTIEFSFTQEGHTLQCQNKHEPFHSYTLLNWEVILARTSRNDDPFKMRKSQAAAIVAYCCAANSIKYGSHQLPSLAYAQGSLALRLCCKVGATYRSP